MARTHRFWFSVLLSFNALLLMLVPITASAALRPLRLAGPDRAAQLPVIELTPTPEGIAVTLQLDGLTCDEVVTEFQGRLGRITVPDEGWTTTISRPGLPVIRRLLPLTGPRPTIELQAASSETIRLAELGCPTPLFPVQPPQSKAGSQTVPPRLLLDGSFYQRDVFWPEGLATVEPVGSWAGQGLALLEVRPVRYNPARGELQVVRRLELLVRPPAAPAGPPREVPWPQAQLFQRLLPTTPTPTAATPVKGLLPAGGGPAGYLILAAPSLIATPALAELVRWKTETGLHTTLVNTADAGGTRDALAAYIRQAYDSWPIRPSFLLLVGDTDTIPAFAGRSDADRAPNDLYYVTVEGDDYFPDLAVGRLPARTPEQLTTMVEKILEYEQHLEASGWEQNGCFLTGLDNSTITEGTHNAVIAELLEPRGYQTDRFYARRRGSEADFFGALAAGRALMVYSGHGDVDGWVDGIDVYNRDLDRQVNAILPWTMSFACLTGSYHEPRCFGEAWLDSPGGGIAFLGSSVNSMWEEDDILEKELFAALLPRDGTAGTTYLGGTIMEGKAGFFRHYGGRGSTLRYYEGYNLLGDPALHLWTASPSLLTPEFAPVIPLASPELQVRTSVAGARVGVSRDGVFVGGGYANQDGVAIIALAPGEVARPGELTLMVTAPDRLPFRDQVWVQSSGDGLIYASRVKMGPRTATQVTVADLDLAGAGTLAITARAAGEADRAEPVRLLLREERGLGVFRGEFTVTCDGREGDLVVADRDQVELNYLDEDDGQGGGDVVKTARVLVDCAPPRFAGLTGLQTGPERVELSWDAAEDETGPITYAIFRSTAAEHQDWSAPWQTTTQLRFVDEQVDNDRWYHYVVRATDGLGNQELNRRQGRAFPQQVQPQLTFRLDEEPGWSMEGGWAFGPPLGQGGRHGSPDPARAATGRNVYGYNLAGEYPDGLATTEYLTTGAIDCSGLVATRLVYRRWLGLEAYDQANLQISTDGERWATLWQNTAGVDDRGWVRITHDIAAWADQQPTVFLRWGLGPTDDSYPYCGWNLDDIEIWGARAFDGPGVVTLDRPAYGIGATPRITLSDPGAQLDPTRAETIEVAVHNRISGDGQLVRLTETGPASGTFTGLVDLVTEATTAREALGVAHGDIIEVRYQDRDDGTGLPRDFLTAARIDLRPPVLSRIRVEEVSDRSAVVRWKTDEPADAEVWCSPERFPAQVASHLEAQLFDHAVILTGLSPQRVHTLQLRSTDVAGNSTSTTVDEEGQALTVTTGDPVAQPDGIVLFDQPDYEVPATVRISVLDSNRSAGPTPPDRLVLRLQGQTEPEGELVVLDRIGDDRFEGTLDLIYGPVAAPDGQLQVGQDEELLTVRYPDDDDGTGTAIERVAQAHARLVTTTVAYSIGRPTGVVAGQPIPIRIRVLDRYGRSAQQGLDPAVLRDSTGTLPPTPVGPFPDGDWDGRVTFTRAARDVVLTVARGDLRSQSAPFTVAAAPAEQLQLAPIDTQWASVPFEVTVTAQDPYGNQADLTGPLTFSASGRPVEVVGGGAQLRQGHWTGQVTLSQAGAGQELTVRLGGLEATSNVFRVEPPEAEGCSIVTSQPGHAPGWFGLLLLLLGGWRLALWRRS